MQKNSSMNNLEYLKMTPCLALVHRSFRNKLPTLTLYEILGYIPYIVIFFLLFSFFYQQLTPYVGFIRAFFVQLRGLGNFCLIACLYTYEFKLSNFYLYILGATDFYIDNYRKT